MITNEIRVVIEGASVIYDQYREMLEAEHRDQFVAIEPVTGDRFVHDAVRAARSAHPSRLSHTIRIGRDVVFHIGLEGGNKGASRRGFASLDPDSRHQ